MNGSIDWEQLEAISDGFSSDFIEIFDELKSEVPRLFSEIDRASNLGDFPQLGRFAHQLKGAVANFGFVKLAKILEVLEKNAKNDEVALVQEKVTEAKDLYARDIVVIEEKIHSIR